MREGGITMGRKWDWILTLPTPREVPRIDLAMLFVEAIIAILIAIGVSLIVFGIGKVLGQRMQSHSRAGKLPLKETPTRFDQ
jgi:predicted phage tail protein